MVEIDDKVEIDVARVTDEGKGIGIAPSGEVVLIDGVKEGDERVRVKILNVFQESALAEKISSVSGESKLAKRKDVVDGPYELDDEEEDDDDVDY